MSELKRRGMNKLCECGCGNPVTKNKNRFLHLHSSRGRKYSRETVAKREITRIKNGNVAKVYSIPCESCGIKMETKRKNKRFCNKTCADKALIKGNQIACDRCNSMFFRSPSRVRERNFCSHTCANNSKTEETKQKHSNYMKTAWINGMREEPVAKSGQYSIRTTYKGHNMRSRLEADIAKQLDALGIDWLYEPERFNLGEFTYLPDFYLPSYDLYIEGKGWEQGLDKVEKFKNTGKKIIVMKHAKFTKEDLVID